MRGDLVVAWARLQTLSYAIFGAVVDAATGLLTRFNGAGRSSRA
jgi:hypothetical protein